MKKFITILIVLTIIFSLGIIVSAEQYEYPELTNRTVSTPLYENNFIYSDGSLVILFSSTVPMVINTSSNPETLYFTAKNSIAPYSWAQYTLDNNMWKIYSSNSNTSIQKSVSGYIQWTNYDLIYDDSSNVFFSPPTPPLYLMDNQTLLQPLSQSVTSNSQILLACGVGILSLILSVGLFRKLYLYL